MNDAPHHLEDYADRLQPRTASSLLLWIILGFFAAFVAWASLVKLDRTVHAPGRIVASGRLQVLSNLEGGVVAAILVRQGDAVRRGQALLRLDDIAGNAELAGSTATVGALTAKVARLQAEIAGREPAYPAAANEADATQIAIERSLHSARIGELASLSAAAQARTAQAARAVAEARAAYGARVAARDAARQQLDLVRPLVERGIEPRITLVQLESSAAVAAGEAAQAQAGIARAQAAVGEARAAVIQARETWRAQAGTDLSTAQAEMAARAGTMPALTDRVRRRVVTAPVDGRVNRVLVSTVGGSVAPNQALVEVVPSADRLTVEAAVNPRDIAAVRIGQRARVNVTAYESSIYGGMEGRVVTISPDATVDERSGESHYTVRIEADAASFRDASGRRLLIGPGMTADVNLLGERRSVMAYILTPFARLAENAARE